jgi:hypothetical protein
LRFLCKDTVMVYVSLIIQVKGKYRFQYSIIKSGICLYTLDPIYWLCSFNTKLEKKRAKSALTFCG